MKALLHLLTLTACLALAASTASANLVDNYGFETGDLTDWDSFGLGWRTGTGADAYEGTYGLVCDVLDWHTGEEWRGVYQSVPVTSGLSYDAGVFIRTVNLDVSISFLELQWLDDVGGVISQETSASVTSDQAFTLMEIQNVTAPVGAVEASLRGIVQMQSLPSTGDSDFHIFDNFTMTAIPEPGTLSLLAAGLLGLALRRRRSR